MAQYGHMAIVGHMAIGPYATNMGNFPLYIPLNTKNRSPGVIYGSITLKFFFVTSYNPMAWVVKRTKLDFKKVFFWDTLAYTQIRDGGIGWGDK